jgi:hypothetical protein
MKSGKSKNVKCLTLNDSWLYKFDALVFIFTRHDSYIHLSINRYLCFLSFSNSLGFQKQKLYIYLRRKSTYILKGDPLIYS